MTDQPHAPEDAGTLQIFGSSLVPLYVERKMKVYALTETEFDSLATRTAQATAFYSVGSFLLSAAISVWVNSAFYTEVPPAAFALKLFMAPLVVAVACAAFWLGWK